MEMRLFLTQRFLTQRLLALMSSPVEKCGPVTTDEGEVTGPTRTIVVPGFRHPPHTGVGGV